MGAILRPRQVLSRPYLGLGGAGVSDFASSLPAISSDSNDKYKAFKSLYIKKSKRETEGCIILETHRTIIDAGMNSYMTNKSNKINLNKKFNFNTYSSFGYETKDNIFDFESPECTPRSFFDPRNRKFQIDKRSLLYHS